MKTVPFLAVLLVLLLISCVPPAESGCDKDAGSTSSGTGGTGVDGGACEQTYPHAAEQTCNVDADCPSDGACYDMRCFPSEDGQRLCQPFKFATGLACIECGVRGLCDADGFCRSQVSSTSTPR